MALLVWVVFFAYVAFRGYEGFRITDLIVLLAPSTLILFIHPWTWGVFATTVLLAAIVALFQEGRKGLRGTATLDLLPSDITGLALFLFYGTLFHQYSSLFRLTLCSSPYLPSQSNSSNSSRDLDRVGCSPKCSCRWLERSP